MVNVAHPRRVTLFLIRLLTIIDFDLNVFLKHFNLLCIGVDLCSILRFTQRVQLLLILMFTRTASEIRKRTLFKYVIKSKLFSKCEYISHSLSISLMTYFRYMQLCHTGPIFLTWREIIAAKFHLSSCSFSKIRPRFEVSMVFEIPVCKSKKIKRPLLTSEIRNQNHTSAF